MRTAEVIRNTNETRIALTLNLDGSGAADIRTGVGFLDHMLTLFSHHGRFDLTLSCDGDTWVDDHHTTEDIGIALGEAFAKALGEKRGIARYGSNKLILTALDLSGRAHVSYDLAILTEKVGTFDTELVEEFFRAFARSAAVTLHVKQLAGTNSHHIIEGAFKSFARSLKAAVRIDPDLAGEIPSTKGTL